MTERQPPNFPLEPPSVDGPAEVDLRSRLHLETAPMAWSALATFFARGQLIAVSRPLSLLDAAVAVAEDDQQRVAQWMEQRRFGLVDDDSARRWQAQSATLWAVVVRPFVLVQEDPERLTPSG